MTDEALTARISRLEARAEISDLISRYARVVDEGDLDALAELFTSDAVLETRGGVTTGREAIVAFFAARRGGRGSSFHTPAGIELTITGDQAHGVVTGHAEQVIDEVTYWIALRYTDGYTVEGGAWRFSRRRIQFRYALPLRELPTALAAPDPVRLPGTPPAPSEV